MRMFNKETDITYSELLNRVYPDLKVCSWVNEKDLPEDEQTTEIKQMGGILKTLTYKEAWKEYWSRAIQEDRDWFLNLPNFDPKIFEEITGISVEIAEDIIEIDGKEYSSSTIKKALQEYYK